MASDKVVICVVSGPEDIVFVMNEECEICTDKKLEVIQRFPTTHEGAVHFLEQADLIPKNGKYQYPAELCKKWWDSYIDSLVCKHCNTKHPSYGKAGDKVPSVCFACNEKSVTKGGYGSGLKKMKTPPYIPQKLPRKVNVKCDC